MWHYFSEIFIGICIFKFVSKYYFLILSQRFLIVPFPWFYYTFTELKLMQKNIYIYIYGYKNDVTFKKIIFFFNL